MQYRKRSEIIEAEQWVPGTPIPYPICPMNDLPVFVERLYPHIHTSLNGWQELSPGDWVARSSMGHYFVIEAAEFARLYEPLVDK